jgi:glutamyl-tRNA reductase
MTKEKIAVVGLNHKTAPVSLRERVALSPSLLKEALETLPKYMSQGVILSTCNRTEVYTTCGTKSSPSKALEFLSAQSGIPTEELAPHLYTLWEEEAVSHLFRVAAGLESMIMGEYEVLGQVRRAAEEAKNSGLVGYSLFELFGQAVRVGRKVREETAISKNAASVSSAAVMLAKKLFGDLGHRQVLLIGAGEAGTLAAKALVKVGACQVTVANRSYSKSAALAAEVKGAAVPFQQLSDALSQADILISCSAAPHYIIKPPLVRQVMGARPSRPLMAIDIAVPCDIDPEVKDIDGVTLYNIDNLSSVAEVNLQLRERETTKATAIIDAEVSKFMDWRNTRDMTPIIKALVDRGEEIRTAQLSRALGEIQDLSAEDKVRLDAMTRAIVKNLLHKPISCLKKQNGHNIQAIKEIFDLEV